MNKIRVLPLPVLLFALSVFLLFAVPFRVHAQEIDATPTLESTLVPTEVPVTIPDEPTATPEEIATQPADPTNIPTEPPLIPTQNTEIPTETPEIPVDTPIFEPTSTPEFTETAFPTPTESPSPTPTVTPTATSLPIVVPLILPRGVEIIPDRYIVVYKSAAAGINASIDSISAPGVSIEHTFSSVINGFSASLSPEALTKLRQDPNIAFIEADQVVWLADDITINSVQTSTTWGLDRIDQRNLPLDGLYNYYQSGAGVNIYLMDSGINTGNPEFGGRATNDFDTVDGGMTDCNGHGTHVAGIIGSSTYGVAKAARIHGARVVNCEGKGSVSSIIAAVDWITANHSKPAVVNLSYTNGPSDAEDLAISKSIAAGITYVAAAGNDSANACQYSPSRIPGVITVGATDLTDMAAGFSNQGPCLDLFAPGSNITSTAIGGSTEIRHGTSMAAPHVAGTAAMFLQSNPSASPADVTNWLITNSTKGAVNSITLASPNRLLYTSPILPAIPSAPILVKPSNGLISNQARPVFAWKKTSTADTYTYQLASDHDFTILIKEETTSSLTYTLDVDLTDGIFYWRVQAVNSNADPTPGEWSEPFLFTVDLQGPPAPALSLPLDKASPVGIPSFTWLPVSGASAYQFMMDDTPDFSSPVLTTPDGSIRGLPALILTNYLPSGLLPEIQYYWHVRARDGLGNWGVWSDSRTLIIQTAIPVSPVQVFPAAGAIFNANPTLTWNSVAGGVYYEVQIANNALFSGTLTEESRKPTGIFSHTISAVLTDGTWYWRVRAVNSTGGAGNWSTVRTFIMDTTGPVAPALISPLTDNTPLAIPFFTWQGPADAKSYQFVMGTSTDGGKTVDPLISTPDGSTPGQVRITVTLYKPANVLVETAYYWHVRAFDVVGNPGVWSESRSIILQSSLPSAPLQVNPANGQYVNSLPALSWNAAATAETYEIQISNSLTFPAPSILFSSGTALTATPAGPLADGMWYWRVRGRNHTSGVGAWSVARVFTLDTLSPLPPVLNSPASGALFAPPVFSWKVVSTATGYQFEFGTASDASIATFSPLYTSPTLTSTLHTPPNLPVGLFYWHVRARDAAGNWSVWTDLRDNFLYAPKIPGPTLLSPLNGSFLNTTNPTLEWKCASGAIGYNIHISDNLTFTGENMHTLVTAGSECFTPVLDSIVNHNGKWYWKVAATNVTGLMGDYSPVSNFTFDDQIPNAPVLAAPLDFSANLRSIPAFIWGPVTGANAYQFQIDDDGFVEPILFSTPGEAVSGTPITTTLYTPLGLKPMVSYSWRVKARDAAQNWSNWSQPRNFTLLPAVPAAPVPVSPATGFLTNDPLPKFTWNGVYSGDTYRIQIDAVGNFLKPVVNEPLGSGVLTYTPSANITDGVYYWRVQSININNESGAWSAARMIIIDTTAPPAPKSLLPVQNSNTLRATPVFSWAVVAGANAYQFQLDDENGFIDPLISTPGGTFPGTPITTISYKTPALTTLTPYFWQVRSRDAAGNWGVWSDTQTFTILPLVPAAPVLGSPATAFVTRTPPVLTWSAAAPAVDYILEIDDDSRFLSPSLSTKTGNLLTYIPSPTDLPVDGTYYWHVRAVNAGNETGLWSASRTFIVDTQAPNPPDLLSPLNNAAGIRTIPFFMWSTPAGAKYFQFQMDGNGFSDPNQIFYSTPGDTVPGTPLTVAYAKPAALPILKAYQWRVRTCDVAGNWSNWSNLRAFTLQPVVPLAPVLVSPVAGTITNNAKPVFVVKDTASIIRYDVELTPITPAGPKTVFDSPAASIPYPSDVLPDGSYYWRARMVNAANEAGAWSSLLLFTVDTQPPAKPVLTVPVNGSANGRVIPVFIWGTVTGAKYYQIQIDDDNTFANPDYITPGGTTPGTPLTVTAYKPASLTPLTVYYWRVRAIDAAGNLGDWSEPANVSILPPIPGTPVQVSPSNGVLTNDPTPYFRWNSVTSADYYEIQVSAAPTFSPMEQSEKVTGGNLTFTPTANLINQGKYYWRVRAVNAKGEPGLWSIVWWFIMDTLPPAPPVLTSPLEDAVLTPGMPFFYWNPPAGAVQYQFEYDDSADLGSPVYTSPDGLIPGLAAIATTAFKPPAMTPAVPYYWHVRARDAAGNWGIWSQPRRISIQALLPGIPVLSSPSDKSFTANRVPGFSWSSAANGYFYEIQVSNTSTFAAIIKDEVTVSANQLTFSFANNLPVGDLFWRVRALNINGKPGNWSTVNKLTVVAGYEFSEDATGWTSRPGASWAVDGGTLSTGGTGVVNSASSAVIDGYFSEFTYEARVKMGFDTATATSVVGNDHGLILFGSDALNTQNEIVNGYIFHIGQKMTGPGVGVGQFGIDIVTNGVKRPLTGTGYLSGPVNFNSWNALKVVSRGTTLTFYINNIQVCTLANTSFRTGRLGVYSVSHVDLSQVFSVDWARLSANP